MLSVGRKCEGYFGTSIEELVGFFRGKISHVSLSEKDGRRGNHIRGVSVHKAGKILLLPKYMISYYSLSILA